MMKKLLALVLSFGVPVLAQTINPDQIKPSTSDDQYLKTTTANTVPGWAPAVDSVTATGPCTANGFTGEAQTGPVTITCAGSNGNSFQLSYTPQGSGQFVLVPFTTVNCTASGGGTALAFSQQGSLGPPLVFGIGGYAIDGGGAGNCTWSVPVLPTGITTAQITAIYGSIFKSSSIFDGNGASETAAAGFHGSGIGACTPLRNSSSTTPVNVPLQFSCQITGTLTNFANITAASSGASNPFERNGSTYSYTPLLEVDYTGTPVTQPQNVNLGPGFGWNGETNTISLLDYAIYPVTVQTLLSIGGPVGTYNLVFDGTSSSDCSTGGGTTVLWCVVNGTGGFTAVPFGSSGGGSPGGSTGAIQYNASPGTFGGSSISGFVKGNGSSAPSTATATDASTLISGLTGCSVSTNAYFPGANNCQSFTGLTNPMTTLGDTIYGGVSGTPTRIAGPTAVAAPYVFTSTPASGVATPPTWSLLGVGGRTVSGTSDTIGILDRGQVVTYTSASNTAVTLPGASTFGSNFVWSLRNNGTALVTVTPSSGTIDSNTTSAGSSLTIAPQAWCVINSPDNVNYTSRCFVGASGGSPSFASILPGTNTLGSLFCGTGCSLGPSGSGVLNANEVNGASVPASKAFVGTNSSGQLIDASTTYGTNSVKGILACDGTTTTCASGVVSAVGGGSSSYTNVVASSTADTTVSAINAKCTGGQTYWASVPITFTAGGTIASGCNVMFVKGGVWSASTAVTITFANPITENDGPSQHFSTNVTVVLAKSNNDYAEWWGAVGDCSGTTCTTDNHVAFQAAINALAAGGNLILQAKGYGQGTTTLTWTSNSTGMIGVAYGNTISGMTPSYLVNNSATATIIDVGDTVTTTFNVFKNFSLERSTTPSGTATGFSAINAQAMTMSKVESFDSIRDFYFTGTAALGSGYMSDLVATWGKLSAFCPSSGTAVYGFYVDGATSALNSMRMGRILGADSCAGLHSTALYLLSATDFEANLLEGDHPYYGIQTSGNMNDTDVKEVRLDLVGCSAIYVNGMDGLLNISDGYINPAGGTACPGIDIESSSGVTIGSGMQVNAGWTTASVYLNSSTGNSVNDLNFKNCVGTGICLLLNSSNNNTVTGNVLAASSYGIVLQSSSNNAINGNVCSAGAGGGSACLKADSSSNHNHYLNNNTVLSGGTLLSDAGTDNQLVSGSTGSSGTVVYTSSQTASTSDNNKLVVMNCTAACAYTLPATQPSTTWQAAVQSIGSTTATIALGGSDTYNGSTSVPVLLNYAILNVWADSVTSTAYRGSTPAVAGSNLTIASASNGQTFAATGGGSSGYTQLAQMVLSSSAASITFSSISQSYTNLELKCRAQSTTTGLKSLTIQFNGDTGSNYSDGAVYGGGNAGPSVSSDTGATAGNIGNASGSDSSTSIFDVSNVEIGSYSSSTGYKDWSASDSLSDTGGTTTNKLNSKAVGGRWFGTPAAITSITVLPSAGSLATGSACTLYGVL